MYDSVARCRQSWATRRSGRLLCRTLTEFAGAGPDGGTYVCPVGEMSTQELGKKLVFQITPGVRWSSADGVLTGYDVARRLLAMADPADPGYHGCWAELIHKTSVRDVYRVDVQLHRSHVLPAALLQSPFFQGNGPYVLRSQSDSEIGGAGNLTLGGVISSAATGGFTKVETKKKDPPQLYDLEADLAETKNLYGAMPEKASELKADMDRIGK